MIYNFQLKTRSGGKLSYYLCVLTDISTKRQSENVFLPGEMSKKLYRKKILVGEGLYSLQR